MEPVTYQPQSQFGIGFEDQGIYGKTMGQTSTLSGMEKLNQANEITILHKRITCTEICCEYDKAHLYQVFDENMQQIYTLEEKSDCCERVWCTNLRSLTMSLKDNNGDEVIRFERPFRCVDCPSNCCYPNKTQVIEMFHQGQFLGRVRERPTCAFTDNHLEVFNDSDEKIYDINGPWCYLECCSVPFDIKNNAGIPNGKIFKQWNGCSGLHGNDKFYLEFPNGINEKTKALLIGATMLVDYMYFEKERQSMQNYYIGIPIGLLLYGVNVGVQASMKKGWLYNVI